MNRDDLPLAEAFASRELAFGAYNPETGNLVLVVEAGSEIEALARVDVVAPLLGYGGVWQLVVVQLESMPPGIATFLSAFFFAMSGGRNKEALAPSGGTVH